MLSFGNLAVLLTLMVMALSRSGSAAEKLATCCTIVDRLPITEPIIGYLVQRANKPCVQAVIFQTESGLYCKHLKAHWVQEKVKAFKIEKLNQTKAKAELPPAPPSPKVSLLSVITSTIGPLRSSSTVESHSSTFVPASSSSSSPEQQTAKTTELVFTSASV